MLSATVSVVTELRRRRALRPFNPLPLCHQGQARLVATAGNVVVVAGRRYGKSVAAVFKALMVATATPDVTACLIAATKTTVKRIFWKTLVRLNQRHGLGGELNRSELSITFPNGSTVALLHVDSEEMADKVRGMSRIALVVIDETQRYKADLLTYLIRDVLRPILVDVRAAGVPAAVWLMGTPNPAGKVGTLWERWNAPRWAKHSGTIYDNSKLGTREAIEAVIEEDLREEGQSRESAWFRREYLAEWAVELSHRVYKFADEANLWRVLPELTHYAIAGDIGVKDNDALLLAGWNDDGPTVYLVREHVRRGQTVADLGFVIEQWCEEFEVLKIALDGGGLGLKTIISLQQMMPALPIEAVHKPAVNIQVAALNDMLSPGLFKVEEGSAFAAEVRNATWVDGLANGKIDEHGHSDVIPAARYLALTVRPYLPDAAELGPRPEPSMQDRYRAARVAMAAQSGLDREAAALGVRFEPSGDDGWD